MPKPSFLCIGAQRCGTTRLHRILSEHPEIEMTKAGVGDFDKEIHYFNRFVLEKPLKWYENHFSDLNVSGEITPAYSVLPEASVKSIKKYLPNAKILFIVRNPLDRIWSQIRMMKAGWNRNPISSEIDLYSLVKLFDSPAVELRSNYLRTFLIWRSAFGENSFLTLSFSELLTQEGLVKLFKFLGVCESWTPTNEASQKVLASQALKLPDELRWLYANRWSTMLENFIKYYPDASTWLNQLLIDQNDIPKHFLDKVRTVRESQAELMRMKWDQSNRYFDALSIAIASRTNFTMTNVD